MREAKKTLALLLTLTMLLSLFSSMGVTAYAEEATFEFIILKNDVMTTSIPNQNMDIGDQDLSTPPPKKCGRLMPPACTARLPRGTSADEKEKTFIEEITRVTYERDKAILQGLPLSAVRPSFAS